jgi:hypothetical protein
MFTGAVIGEEIMKCGAQVALAVAGGYLLGRRKKTRLALMLGGAALTGRIPGAAGQLVRSGTKALGSTDILSKAAPGLGEVGDMVKGDLTSVAKRAAATAISTQIESLSDQLRNRADAMRQESTGRAGRPDKADEADEEGPIDEEGPEEGPEDDIEEEPVPRRRGAAARRRDERDEEAEADDEEPAEARPRVGARPGRTGRPASSGRATSPIRRTQR